MIRTRSGELRGVYNVCRHRGPQLVLDEPDDGVGCRRIGGQGRGPVPVSRLDVRPGGRAPHRAVPRGERRAAAGPTALVRGRGRDVGRLRVRPPLAGGPFAAALARRVAGRCGRADGELPPRRASRRAAQVQRRGLEPEGDRRSASTCAATSATGWVIPPPGPLPTRTPRGTWSALEAGAARPCTRWRCLRTYRRTGPPPRRRAARRTHSDGSPIRRSRAPAAQ